MKTNFIVLAGPRTGSTAVCRWLNSHPAIRCHEEVLHKWTRIPDAILAFISARNYPCHYDSGMLAFPNDACTNGMLRDFLESLFTNPQHPAPWNDEQDRKGGNDNKQYEAIRAVGFKFMYYLLDNRYLNAWIEGGAVRIIHLVRENLLKQVVSYLAAKQRNVWHSDKPVDAIRIHVDTATLVPMLAELEHKRRLLDQRISGARSLRITYEQFCQDPRALASGITDFLGVEEASMCAPPYVKLNTDVLSDLLENYDAVVRCLQNTPFARHLVDEPAIAGPAKQQ